MQAVFTKFYYIKYKILTVTQQQRSYVKGTNNFDKQSPKAKNYNNNQSSRLSVTK